MKSDLGLIGIETVVRWLAWLYLSRQKLAQQQASLHFVRPLLHYNHILEGLFREIKIAANLEMLAVEYAGSYNPKFHSLMVQGQEDSREDKANKNADVGENPKRLRNSVNKQSIGTSGLQPSTLAPAIKSNRPKDRSSGSAKMILLPFPNVGLLLHSAIMRNSAQSPTNLKRDIDSHIQRILQKGSETSSPNSYVQSAQNSGIFRILDDTVKASMKIMFPDETNSFALTPVRVSINLYSMNRRLSLAKNRLTEQGQAASEQQVMRLPHILSSTVSNLPSWRFVPTSPGSVSQISKVRPNISKNATTDDLSAGQNLSKKASRAEGAFSQGGKKAKANDAALAAKQLPVYRTLYKSLRNLPDAASSSSSVLEQTRLFSPSFLHGTLLHSILASEDAQDKLLAFQRQPGMGLKDFMARTSATSTNASAASELHPLPYPKQHDSSSIEMPSTFLPSNQSNQLSPSTLPLILSVSTVSETVKRAVTQSLGFAYRQSMKMGKVPKERDQLLLAEADVSRFHFAPSAFRELGKIKPSDDKLLTKNLEILEQSSSDARQRHDLSDRRRIGNIGLEKEGGGKADVREQYLASPVAGLQQTYSQYAFHRLVRSSKGGSSIALVRSPLQSDPLISPPDGKALQKRNKGNAVSLRRMKDGAIDLPLIAQLQVMFANHFVGKRGATTGTTSTLSLGEVLTSSVPPDPVHSNLKGRYHTSIREDNDILSYREKNGMAFADASVLRKRELKQGHGRDDRSASSRQEKPDKGISMRDLRKKMEQIFQEELKRYGL